MKKRYLLAPGPTPVPERVLQAMSLPMIHHRTPEFESIMESVRNDLKYLFQTEKEVLILACSGTGAMEGAVVNLLSRGDRAVVVRGGKFGERWAEICNAYGVEVINIDITWGEAVDPAIIKETINKNKDVKAVFIQATETSTGVKHPVKEIAEIIRDHPETALVVDGITGVGVFDIPMDRWGIDLLVGGSQKALMLPPGLAFACLSDKAWKMVERSNLPKYYFDFRKELKNLLKNQSAYTPAVSLVIGLHESLKMIRDEGLENVFSRHRRFAEATRAAVQALGLKLYAPKSPSEAVTAVLAPEGIDAQKIVKIMRDKHGVIIAGGQDRAKGKIFRISHMGYIDRFDLITAISALEMTLLELGYSFDLGIGVKTMEEYLR